MGSRKAHLRLRNVNSNGAKSKNGIAISLKKGSEPVDHWDFLDEIEAPMWADLDVECKSTYTDKDDDWFHTSHLFHQSSSRELKSAFSCIGEMYTDMDSGTQQPSSPGLPPSVSRSRGKDYRSREWMKGNQKITLSKKHPIMNLNIKPARANTRFTKATKDRTIHTKLKQPQKSSMTSNSSSTITYEDGGQHHQKTFETSTSSGAVTSELQPPKSTEMTRQVLGQTSDFLPALKIILRKSCVTRPASRAVVNNSQSQSEGRKSGSSKSSVGSSNTLKEGRNLSTSQIKDRTPESRNVFRMSHHPKEKMKLTNMPKGHHHTHITQQKPFISNRGNRSVIPNAVSKAKENKGSKFKRTMRSGKENAPEVMSESQNPSLREREATDRVQSPKVLKGRVPGTRATTTLTGLKVTLDNRCEVKKNVFLR